MLLFFYGEEYSHCHTKDFICGEASFEKSKEWAQGGGSSLVMH